MSFSLSSSSTAEQIAGYFSDSWTFRIIEIVSVTGQTDIKWAFKCLCCETLPLRLFPWNSDTLTYGTAAASSPVTWLLAVRGGVTVSFSMKSRSDGPSRSRDRVHCFCVSAADDDGGELVVQSCRLSYKTRLQLRRRRSRTPRPLVYDRQHPYRKDNIAPHNLTTSVTTMYAFSFFL